MTLAITLAARNETTQHVEILWDEAARFERTPSMRATGYPPHLTFAIFDRIEEASLIRLLRSVFIGRGSVSQTFDRLAFFDSDPLVLWAAPGGTDELHSIHDEIHAGADTSLCDPHYRPGGWVPHCTLAVDVSPERRADALEFAQKPIPPFALRFDQAELIEVERLRVVETVALGDVV